MTRRLLYVLVAIALVVTAVKVGPQVFPNEATYVAELPDAAGIRPGDDVRLAGVPVGSVTELEAATDRVEVTFTVSDGVDVPADTRTEVKLASLLGQRYINLTPGDGDPLASGATIPLKNASGSYTLERFWLDNSGTLEGLDKAKLSAAVDVLTRDLSGDPGTTQAALDGMTQVAAMVNKRNDQITELVSSTRRITDQAVAQRAQLTSLLTNADTVFAMIEERKEAIDALLRDSRALVVRLTAMAERNQAPMKAALSQLHTILGTLAANREALARTLQLAEPALRLYVNGGGDGPWLGVNAPYLVLPDSLWCLVRRDIGCQ